MIATIQISDSGEWITAATYDGSYLEYEADYILDPGDSPLNRVGLRYPVNFEMYRQTVWPAFLLDIIPSGAGRRVWLRRLGLNLGSDGENNNWTLLINGSGNPPGNIRIREAAIELPAIPHHGFSMAEVVEKNADFIEYAEQMGAVVAGATDIPGDAPKFMLVQAENGRWHPDGSLADSEVRSSYIIKFPRGRTAQDRLVLRNEAPYYETARRFGVRCGNPLVYRDNTLLISRFDRIPVAGKVIRLGLETICSVANVSEYGKRGNHAEFCRAIAAVATDPKAEIYEYLKREILNVALRNVDNHGRNTALIKLAADRIELSPLYDFAPMFLDPDGIARASLWPSGAETTIGRPDWHNVAELLAGLVDPGETKRFLAKHAPSVRALPDIMKECGVELRVIEGVALRCAEVASDLARL
jgi:serine/threonine-protein kinase HipA